MPSVADAAFGAPDERAHDRVKAYWVLAAGHLTRRFAQNELPGSLKRESRPTNIPPAAIEFRHPPISE